MADTRRPFFLELPKGTAYFEILSSSQSHAMRSGLVCLEPGQSCGLHTTGAHEEVLVFLEGSGETLIEGQHPIAVQEGGIAYIPPHTPHNVQNTGQHRLCYIYVVSTV
ncbi:MAG: cupin domain-containing protein [Bacteroidetes bacterium]|nr:cupin domain-containing protein [Bacteroidota bacterium]